MNIYLSLIAIILGTVIEILYLIVPSLFANDYVKIIAGIVISIDVLALLEILLKL